MTWGLKLGPSLHVKQIMKFEVQPHKTTLSNIDDVNEIQRIWPTFGLITPYKWQIEPNLHLGPHNDLRSQTWSESPRQTNYEIWGPATQDYFVEYRRCERDTADLADIRAHYTIQVTDWAKLALRST